MVRSNILHHFTRQLVALICLLLVLAISSSVGLAASANAQAAPVSPNDPLAPASHQLYLPLLANSTNDSIWADTAPSAISAQGERVIIPQKYRAVTLNVNALQQLLQATPLERSATAQSAQVIFSLPLPDGTSGRFRIVESPIMEPGLAAKFPAIAGQHAEYLELQLKAFRAVERSNDAGQMMRAIAAKMTDPEIKAVASYVQGLQ